MLPRADASSAGPVAATSSAQGLPILPRATPMSADDVQDSSVPTQGDNAHETTENGAVPQLKRKVCEPCESNNTLPAHAIAPADPPVKQNKR